jgi:uncharacterized membrane protein
MGLEHPVVRDYLRELEGALAMLPVGQASELKEQILAHLEDAPGPDMGSEEVAEVLHRLGKPSELEAETVATTSSLEAPGVAGRIRCLD